MAPDSSIPAFSINAVHSERKRSTQLELVVSICSLVKAHQEEFGSEHTSSTLPMTMCLPGASSGGFFYLRCVVALAEVVPRDKQGSYPGCRSCDYSMQQYQGSDHHCGMGSWLCPDEKWCGCGRIERF